MNRKILESNPVQLITLTLINTNGSYIYLSQRALILHILYSILSSKPNLLVGNDPVKP